MLRMAGAWVVFALATSSASMVVDLRMSLGEYDFQTAARGGFEASWGQSLWAGFADLEIRAVPRKTRVIQSPSLTYQYRENRYSFGPGFTVAYPLASMLFFTGGAGVFYSVGDFRGSSRLPTQSGSGWAETGLRLGDKGICWQLLYQYHPLPYVAPHRVALQFGWRLQ